MSLIAAIQTLSHAAAIGYALQLRQPPSWARAAPKAVSTLLLATLAYLRSSPHLLTAALALGSLGDVFLAWDSDAAFIRGLASFLSAHIFCGLLQSLFMIASSKK